MDARRVEIGETIVIVVPGPPMGKPRMTQRDKWQKRPAVVRYREWCDRVREIAGQLPDAKQVASLSWTAYFAPPPSWSKADTLSALGRLHRQRPDRDNIDKAVLDCLFKDDSGIARGSLLKLWDREPRIEIVIEVERS